VTADFAERLDLPPEMRMVSYSYREEFGHPPAAVWRVPGSVTLLARGPERLTVTPPWGAIAAATPRDDGVLELARMQRPGKRKRETGALGATGATAMVSSELPDGSGAGTGAATAAAIRMSLRTGTAFRDDDTGGPGALLGHRHLPLDLAAGLRLMIIDTRIRDVPLPPFPDEKSPLDEAAEAIGAGDMRVLGRLLTSAHVARADSCDEAQDIAVSMALRTGALGARSITDGPGRPVLALVPVHRLRDVRATVSDWFTGHEMRVPRFLTFTPGGPAAALEPAAAGADWRFCGFCRPAGRRPVVPGGPGHGHQQDGGTDDAGYAQALAEEDRREHRRRERFQER
jgi:galactokinase